MTASSLAFWAVSVLALPVCRADNPIIQTKFTADPAPLVYNGRLYLYTSHDDDNATGFTMYNWLLYSTTDMVNWTDHGIVAGVADPYKTFKWADGNNAWAPQVVARGGKFYLYVPFPRSGHMVIGVAVANDPTGPFVDALGGPLVYQASFSTDIDPTVFIDDDGQAYLYWGHQPDLSYVKLNQDMVSYSGGIVHVTRPQTFEEGPWFYRRNGNYYLAFASTCCPEGIGYAMSTSPTGPWTYKGSIMDGNAASSGNHPGIVDYLGSSYVFGFNYALNAALTTTHRERRSVCVEKFSYAADGTIPKLPFWSTTGAPQIGHLDPYVRTEAETIAGSQGLKTETCGEGGMDVTAIENGDFIKVKGVDFGAGATSFDARVASATSGGSIEIRLDSQTGTRVATCAITGTGGAQTWVTKSCSVTGASGVHDLFFVFTGGSGSLFNFNFNWWKFSAQQGADGGADAAPSDGGGLDAGAGGVGGRGGAGGDAGAGVAGTGGAVGGGAGGSARGGAGGAESGRGGTGPAGAGGAIPGGNGGAGSGGTGGAQVGAGSGGAMASGGAAGRGGASNGSGGTTGAGGGAAPDGRTTGSSGCSCEVGGPSGPAGGLVAFLACVCTLAWRRRRGRFDRRLFIAIAAASCWPAAARAQTQPTSYTASWASVDQHPPAPEWFKDAKFGIYFHWGAFGTARFENEWYPRNMFNKSDGAYTHHLNMFGDPFGSWGFDKFITGANDKMGRFVQFAPRLVTNGGAWDPDAMAQLIVDAGAWFAGPVAEHHDGFSMWDSKVNAWNSVAKGPLLNMAQVHAQAFRKKGLKFLMAMHHAYHFTGYYQFVPQQTDPSLKLLYGQQGGAAENQLWYDKLKEIIDEFQPDIIWQDFNLPQVTESLRLQFLAYYYNAALTWKKEVVATYKDGFDNKGEVYDYERGGAGDITNPYWLTDDAVSPSSWCYTDGMGYYTAAQEVHTFIDHVSKNGSLLLNISPMPDGSIPQQQKDLLNAFGAFLKQNGTAIYNTRAWMVYGEGPTKIGGGSFSGPVAGTPQDVRYTASKDGDAVYAILLGWPGNGKQVTLASVTPTRFNVGTGKVFLFGPVGGQAINLTFSQDGSGLRVTLPSTQPYTAVAYAIKISKSGTVPAPTPSINNATTMPAPDGGVPDGGGSDAGAAGSDGGIGGRGGAGGGTGGVGGTGGGTGAGDGRGGASGSGGAAGAAGAAGTIGGAGTTGAAGTTTDAGASGVAGTSSSGGAGGAAGGESGASGCSCALAGGADRNAAPLWILTALALRVRRPRSRR